ncbi:hypothetical protein PG996_013833 [Apiospora saccharicola]|uniref:Cell wall protein n=1 Tax=Apiospora saccharicola TaxID=335842 RepID=A0ABR1TJ53_9PEZI
MKYATAAAAVLPLAWAASIETRGQDSKYNVSQLEAACDSNDKCSYNFKIATGDADATDCSMKSLMKMGTAPETKCGPYAVSAMKPHDGGLIFLIDQAGKGLSGTFTAYPKDFKSGDDDKTMSYNGGASFDVAAKAVKVAGGDDETPSTTGGAGPKVSSIASHAAMDPPESSTASAKLSMISSVGVGGGPVMGSTTKVASADSTAVPTGSLKVASSGAPTAASGGSTMATATATDSSSSSSSTSTSDESSSSASSSDSASSSSSSDESSGATRQSAFAGVMAAVGLMAFAF